MSVLSPEIAPPTRTAAQSATSSQISTHSMIRPLRLHHSALRADNSLAHGDEDIEIEERLDHSQLSERKQRFLLDAILADADMSAHLQRAVDSLRVVLAADESIRTGRVVELSM